MQKIYESTRHPAVPRHMSDLAYKVATSTDLVGARYFKKEDPRRRCPRCNGEDSAEHKFRKCEEVAKLWKIVGTAWTRVTGEKLDWTDDWVTAWGAR